MGFSSQLKWEGLNPIYRQGVNFFEMFAKHQLGVAGCGWLQPGRNFLSTSHYRAIQPILNGFFLNMSHFKGLETDDDSSHHSMTLTLF